MATSSCWNPTPEQVESARVTRLARRHGIATLAELRERSVADPEWFWDAVVEDLGVRFEEPYRRVIDDSLGAAWSKWFVGGQINVAAACVDRWAAETPDRRALIAESEDGESRVLTFGQLRAEVDAVANALRNGGVGSGDVVAIYMPMVPEAVAAFYAIAKVGAIALPIFSGFAAPAISARLRDSGAKLLFTAERTSRRGDVLDLRSRAQEALADSPGVERVVTLDDWEEFAGPHRGDAADPEPTDSEHPFLLAYTSGTTGQPKGAVHVHGGFTVKIAAEAAYQTDVGQGDVLFWFTDLGWIMGAWSLIGAHANGAAAVILDGAPDFPDPGRLWDLVARHEVTTLGVSPTLVRALSPHGRQWPDAHNLSSLRTLAIAGEPCDEGSWQWLFGLTGRLPIINLSGGTEVGACFLSAHPVEPLASCSLGGAALGMDVDVFDAAGEPVREQVGELVCKSPWPGMTRGIWGDDERFVESYWSTYPDVWRHGDWALIDGDGQWYLLGRSDDVINVAGKRVAPAEVEAPLLAHPRVSEAAAVGIPDALKGEAIWCFVVADDACEAELAELVAAQLGRPFKPARVEIVHALPKTTSGKIVRRAIRAVALGEDPGDLSTTENPSALQAIRAQLAGVA